MLIGHSGDWIHDLLNYAMKMHHPSRYLAFGTNAEQVSWQII